MDVRNFYGNQLYAPDFVAISKLYSDYKIGKRYKAIDEQVLEINERRIVSLNLEDKNLTEFPKVITELDALVYLDLSINGISSIPNDIIYLEKLQELNISYNKLKHLPIAIREVPLESLNLRGNDFSRIPPCLIGMADLVNLDVRNNRIEKRDSTLHKLMRQRKDILF